MPRGKKTSLYLVGALLAVSLTFVAKGGLASAAPDILTMTPTAARPVVNPGSTTTGTFQIVNQGQTSYSVHIYAAPYSVKGEDYTPDFSPVPDKPDVPSWLQFSAMQDKVAAGQTATVHYTLDVPQGTPAGGYYAVAFAETQLPKSAAGVVVNERVGELFYIQVSGPVKQSGKLLNWSSSFFQKPPLTATLRVENDGNLHYASDIHIVVRDLFGRAKYTLNAQKEVLPQTIRRIPDTWNHAPAFGLFKVNGTVTILGKQQALSTKYVLVMSPTVRIASLIVLIILVAGTLFVGVSKRKRHGRRPKSDKK